MQRKKIALSLILMFASICLFANGKNESVLNSNVIQTVIDGAGREVEVPTEVTKVVSLITGITGMLYEIEAGDKVVGVTKSMPYPTTYAYPYTDILPDVGSIANINVEQIVALDPDLVLTTEFFLNAAGVLDERDIPVVAIRLDTLSDILWNIKFIGALVGNKDEADALATSM